MSSKINKTVYNIRENQLMNNSKKSKVFINEMDSNEFTIEKVDNSNPQDIIFLNNIINDSYSNYRFMDTFCVFTSINNILYLIYSNENNSIISFNLIDNKKINIIRNAHDKYICSFRHFLDNIKMRDLIMSISSDDNNIKLWNIINLELILNIQSIYNNGALYSACFLNNNDQNYIITSNSYISTKESIKVFDFKGNQIQEINDSKDDVFFIDIYYDNDLFKNFILTSNRGYSKSYNYNENKLYHKYNEDNNNYHHNWHNHIIINKIKKVIELIESCDDGYIKIWNFHSALILKKIKVNNKRLVEICMWNNDYIFVGCNDKTIKLIELNNGNVIKELKGHDGVVFSIKTIIHYKYGKCLISQGSDDIIKLWIIKNNYLAK